MSINESAAMQMHRLSKKPMSELQMLKKIQVIKDKALIKTINEITELYNCNTKLKSYEIFKLIK